MAPNFDDGGAELFESLSLPTDSAEIRALITEAARSKDRLDQLDLALSGDDHLWMRLVTTRGGDDTDLEIKIDGALTEARQLATVFRQLLAEIARRRGPDPNSDDDDPITRLGR
jgi:hypothetical protein